MLLLPYSSNERRTLDAASINISIPMQDVYLRAVSIRRRRLNE